MLTRNCSFFKRFVTDSEIEKQASDDFDTPHSHYITDAHTCTLNNHKHPHTSPAQAFPEQRRSSRKKSLPERFKDCFELVVPFLTSLQV